MGEREKKIGRFEESADFGVLFKALGEPVVIVQFGSYVTLGEMHNLKFKKQIIQRKGINSGVAIR